jgi:serine/threonine-protein kinase
MEGSDPSLIETIAQPVAAAAAAPSRPSSISSSSSSAIEDEGRFIAGTLLAGRYRILGLLGRGGMGEVYRATDLMLGQSVALKFLPEEAARDQRLLERFHGEVRIARQVSHPNVCRVYDIGQMDGMPYISMEYVDGEDLSSLLTRIGRLPADKAIEAARKLCAGLAAAHDRGVIHRDLKPQNIMINKRGEVVIMDFGLAAVAAQLTGQESRNGTPAYMSPEQLKGAEVTARSDIYALGLVLYELFTGKRPFEAKTIRQLIDLQESAQLTSMTSIAVDVDPTVEKVIRRCLDPDPSKRPLSPLSVAAALPGGDPLAEALAAGEMPSPELVAASGKLEGLERRFSVPLLITTVACLFAAIPMHTNAVAELHAPLDIPPDALQHKAREFAASFGYPERPADSIVWMEHRQKTVAAMAKLPEPRNWEEWLASESPIQAVIRESPKPLAAKPDGIVSETNPAPVEEGMAKIVVDGGGKLLLFEMVPRSAQPVEPVPVDVVFRAAGLDVAKFTEGTPGDSLPRFRYDLVRSWSSPHPLIPGVTEEVEIAWLKGRVAMARFSPRFPDGKSKENKDPKSQSSLWYLELFSNGAAAVGMFFCILMARKNWKTNRCDRRGAIRVGGVILIAGLLVWGAKVHVAGVELISAWLGAAGDWLFGALAVWCLYLALEPAVRSRWPHSLVSWNRLLAGNWMDAQVGSDLLIGSAIGALLWVSVSMIDFWLVPHNTLASGLNLWAAESTRHWIGANAIQVETSLFIGLIGFFTIIGMRIWLKHDIAAALAASLVFTVMRPGVFNEEHLWIMLAIWIALYASLVFTLIRFGLVPTLAAVFYINSYQYMTIGSLRAGWMTGSGIATLSLLIGLAVFAFWRSMGARELIGGDVN